MLPPGPWTKAFSSWSISSWSLLLFFNDLDLPWQTNHARQALRKRQTIFQWDRRFFFFLKRNVRRPPDLPDMLRRHCRRCLHPFPWARAHNLPLLFLLIWTCCCSFLPAVHLLAFLLPVLQSHVFFILLTLSTSEQALRNMLLYSLFQPWHGSPNVTVPTCTINKYTTLLKDSVGRRSFMRVVSILRVVNTQTGLQIGKASCVTPRMRFPKAAQADDHFLLLLWLSCERGLVKKIKSTPGTHGFRWPWQDKTPGNGQTKTFFQDHITKPWWPSFAHWRALAIKTLKPELNNVKRKWELAFSREIYQRSSFPFLTLSSLL